MTIVAPMSSTFTGSPVEVAGCDVAKGWWVAVVAVDGRIERAVRGQSFAEVVDACPLVVTFVVDIPIGIPTDGRRAADEEARLAVGARRNSVFSTPVRAALEASSHAAAVEASRAAIGSGVSQQAWALRTMIFDVEDVAEADPRVHEGHPEVSFAQMAGAELADSKKTWNGMQRRLALLRERGLEIPEPLGDAGRAGPDDVVDATALAWTAMRIAAGTSRRLGASTGRAFTIHV